MKNVENIFMLVISLAIFGLIVTHLGPLDDLINAFSRATIRELAVLELRPDYQTIV